MFNKQLPEEGGEQRMGEPLVCSVFVDFHGVSTLITPSSSYQYVTDSKLGRDVHRQCLLALGELAPAHTDRIYPRFLVSSLILRSGTSLITGVLGPSPSRLVNHLSNIRTPELWPQRQKSLNLKS